MAKHRARGNSSISGKPYGQIKGGSSSESAKAVAGFKFLSLGEGDLEFGLSSTGVTPQGPLHGEASNANASVGSPAMRNRSSKTPRVTHFNVMGVRNS